MLQNDIFYNRQRSGYEELTSYMPLYWREILEMRANNTFAGFTIDRMADALEEFALNLFFDSCSEEVIEEYENFLHLTGYGLRNLEDRRNLVKASWIGNQKMSRPRIKSLVRAYCGCDSEVHFTHEVTIAIKATDSTSETIYVGDLLHVLSEQIPTHLSWTAIMNIQPTSIKVGRSIVYWRYDYQKCGVNPDVATLGEAIETDCQVDTQTNAYVYNNEPSGVGVSGTTPGIATIGVELVSRLDMETNADAYKYEIKQASSNSEGEEDS